MGVQLNEDKFYHVSFAWSASSVAANTTAEQAVTVNGLKAGLDKAITCTKLTAQPGLGIVGRRVSADNTLAITFINATASPITPTPNDAYSLTVIRPEKTYTSIPA